MAKQTHNVSFLHNTVTAFTLSHPHYLSLMCVHWSAVKEGRKTGIGLHVIQTSLCSAELKMFLMMYLMVPRHKKSHIKLKKTINVSQMIANYIFSSPFLPEGIL